MFTSRPAAFIDQNKASILMAVGNYFKFVVINRRGSLTMSVMMTARKVISALISMFMFNASLGNLGLIGCGLVLMAILMDFMDTSASGKPAAKPVDSKKSDKTKTD